MDSAKLELNGSTYELPVIVGTENEVGIDMTKFRATSGAVTFDPGYGNTGAWIRLLVFSLQSSYNRGTIH